MVPPTIYTLTEVHWRDLVRRMYGEGVMEADLHRGPDGSIAVTGSAQDMVLFLTHVAELTMIDDRFGPATTMERVRYLIDQVRWDGDEMWSLPCVRVWL